MTEAKDLQEQTKSPVLTDESRKKAQADLEAMCEKLLANTVIENYRIELI